MRIGDFAIDGRTVTLVKTGNSATLGWTVVAEVAIWLACYATVRMRAALIHRGRRRSIWFTPDVPHPRYMVRIAAIWAGFQVAADPAGADAAFFFDDATISVPPPPCHVRALNFGCPDISKGRVADVFARVFGYPLAIDPAAWSGPAVEKSETNGTHDGRIVACPCPARPGFAYQRVIDNRDGGLTIDLRTHVVAGRVVAVWIKRRQIATRFQPVNVSATLVAADAVFSAGELAAIGRFADAMGADWAGLDILRDGPSGRIYVVDVNKTDAGPIIALPLREKLRSIARLAAALTDLVQPASPSSAVAKASTRASKAA